MQHKLITETATFSAPRHCTGTARRPVQTVTVAPVSWRVTFALAAATFAATFAVVAFIL